MLRLGLIVVSFILDHIPTRVLGWLGDAMGMVWFYLIPIRRKIVIENLELAFGDSLSHSELKKLAVKNYRHYGRSILEILKSFSWDAEQFQQQISMHGLENVSQYYQNGVGGYILTCHLGNWELLVGSGAAWGIPADIVVKRARNQLFEGILNWYRNRLGVGILIETGTAKDILRSISKGRFVGFVLDQFMGPPIGLPVKFFGQLAGTTVSLALLTEKRDVPIVPAYSYRDDKGRLHTVIEPALKLPNFSTDKDQRLFEKTQFFNDVLEDMVKRHPEQWLWLHRRWKAYRGEPRWKLKTVISFALVLFGLVGLNACTSTPPQESTPTGIALPADTKVNIPKFVSQDDDLDAPTPAKTEEVPKKVVVAPTHKPKRGKVEKTVELPAKPAETVIEEIPSERIPFAVGERQEVQLSWVGLPAGIATMEVRKNDDFNGRPTIMLWANVLSSKLVDAIYHVDNTVETVVDSSALIPYKFLLHMVESAQLKETKVTYDHPLGKAYYWAQRVSKKWGNETNDRVDPLIPNSRDMFSAIYYARTLNYQLNQKQEFPIYENGKNWGVVLLPIANEMVSTKVGVFQCWKIKVTVKLNNVLSPTGDIFMWLSDDSKRYLVKFDAKIKIGSLYGYLVALKDAKP